MKTFKSDEKYNKKKIFWSVEISKKFAEHVMKYSKK